jgi:hypothetical protein
MIMNNKIYIFLIFSFILLTFAFNSGCGKYITQYSAPVIIDRYPANGATGVASGETIWVKFSKTMNENNMTLSELGQKMKAATDMTAVATFYPELTPEVTWVEDNTKLVVTNVFFVGTTDDIVHLISSKDAFVDTNGLFLQEDAVLWNYKLQ